MNISLVGYTGFVGSNLVRSVDFSRLYNSKNIQEAFGTKPDILVYAGVRAEKFLANQNPLADMEIIEQAFQNIQRIQPHKLVLISSIDVYRKPVDVDEDSFIDTEGLCPYGANRYSLEKKVREAYPKAMIVRLPGIFGENIKKNFIYDYMNIIPAMLKKTKFDELRTSDSRLTDYYTAQNNGFYKCNALSEHQKKELKTIFNSLGFSALNFTDSRAVFQFYNLRHLWKHLEFMLNDDILLLNMATEPIAVSELYRYLTHREFQNIITDDPPYYNFRTKYDTLFGGASGYLFDKSYILKEIKEFTEEYM